MKKPHLLREALTAALDGKHHVRANPHLIDITVTDLNLLASGRPGAGFQYRYTLQIILMDFAGEAEEVTVPLMIWVERYQHELVASQDAATKGLVMTVKLLESGKSDILIDLQLTESLRFTPRTLENGGGYDVVFADEPLPMALEEGAPLHVVYLDGEVIARCEAHPEVAS